METSVASIFDIKVLEKLSDVLPKYIDPADVPYVLHQIREEIYTTFSLPKIEYFHQAVQKCIKCIETFKPDVQMPKWNMVNPDLLIVTLSPVQIEQWGQILIDGLKQAGFSSDRCALTYAARCPAVSTKELAVAMDNCMDYIHTEIHILKPKLVMVLGLPVYQKITGNMGAAAKDVIGRINWYGMYPFLGQHSLGLIKNAQDQNYTATIESFHATMQYAHRYLYND